MIEKSGNQFGAFKGVFTPSILTILGVIMYLRFGWVLGNLGLPLTLVVVTLATSITLLTGLSLSATATNMHIGGGGAYFIISRSLGVEVGAAIGVPLFLAQSIGVAFYLSGFAEAFVSVVSPEPILEMLPFAISPARFVAVVSLILLTLIAYVSANLALRTQVLIMGVIGLSLLSLFAGSAPDPAVVAEASEPFIPLSFWVVFAVFFPAVTGIEAGISLSGDLKDPAKSLPRGTLAAVGVGYLIYMLIPVFLWRLVPDPSVLVHEPMIMQRVARVGSLIVLGVWAATLSSALGALLGAPRTLQALSRDRILPRQLGIGFGEAQEPRIATAVTFVVALVAILLGDLNLLAPILSMFFLTSYGLINFSAGLEGAINSPTWRPQFRVPVWGSLLGAGGCLVVMLMINAGATLVALLITGAIYTWMKRRNLRAQWGDMRYGLLMLLARFAVSHLARRTEKDERSWRPNILVLSGSPQKRWYLIELARALAKCTSCVTVASVVPSGKAYSGRQEQLERAIASYLKKQDADALIKVIGDDDVLSGMEALVRAYGFGPIAPNTVLMGESVDPASMSRFVGLLLLIHRLKRNLVLVREDENAEPRVEGGRLDIWWRGRESNIGLTLTLAYLLKRDAAWAKSEIVIKRIVEGEDEQSESEDSLNAYIREQRLRDVRIELLRKDGKPIGQHIREGSEGAGLVFMGLRPPEEDETAETYLDYYRKLMDTTEGVPVVLVLSADAVDYRNIIGLS